MRPLVFDSLDVSSLNRGIPASQSAGSEASCRRRPRSSSSRLGFSHFFIVSLPKIDAMQLGTSE
jgi:hypothetical protein